MFERDAERAAQELFDEIGPFRREQGDGRGIAQAAPGFFDIRRETLRCVSLRASDDSPLRPERVGRLGLFGSGNDENTGARPRSGERRRTAGNAGSDHENVVDLAHTASSSREMSLARTEWVSAPTETKFAPDSA